jgi:hypothetical protein
LNALARPRRSLGDGVEDQIRRRAVDGDSQHFLECAAGQYGEEESGAETVSRGGQSDADACETGQEGERPGELSPGDTDRGDQPVGDEELHERTGSDDDAIEGGVERGEGARIDGS